MTDLDERPAGEGDAGPSGASAADPSEFVRREGEGSLAYAARIFERVYNRGIESVLSMEVLPSICHTADSLFTQRSGGRGYKS